jgi:four helix bundle protein
MTNEETNKKKYDLVERTSEFGKMVILLMKEIPDNTINRPLITQLIRSATSVGANYMEADCAESKKDFLHKIGICKKEAKETTHWLSMIVVSNPQKFEVCEKLKKEAQELTLIFSAIIINKK